jgi:pimeloyl-ACP methyl ester carboxylesterase
VVTYVARAKRRAEIQKTLADIIDTAADRAPYARILVVGHSLGSVLVTHAVRNAHEAAGRMIVLTLGSPLRLLSRVFPRAIESPDALLASYAQTGSLVFWANLWRDRDVIGRALSPAASDRFVETSIGNGVHWDMWHDVRLWRHVDELLGASSIAAVKAAWTEREDHLSEDEAVEAVTREVVGVTRRATLGGVRRAVSFCFTCLIVIALASVGCAFLLFPYR